MFVVPIKFTDGKTFVYCLDAFFEETVKLSFVVGCECSFIYHNLVVMRSPNICYNPENFQLLDKPKVAH